MRIAKTGNTWGIEGEDRAWSITFWKRAIASTGRTEAWRHEGGFYGAFTAWGWMVTVERKLPYMEGPVSPGGYQHSYYRGLWAIDLPWLHYDKNRGGAFTHFKWGQRLAHWKKERAEARRLHMLQTRKCWWEASRGQWWEFDKDETKSYYKFLRAVYGMNASEAWRQAKRHTRETEELMMGDE